VTITAGGHAAGRDLTISSPSQEGWKDGT
jgi:hypothetical protein